ncbi:uncharacterized protein LOC127867457 [Dreissena polymorpha]|uniref:Uncharacterized protein n=1 Tax=Dreissena polymorpha TaxID=45954 RepID=A0A9D4M0L3_DREPO|nr:uncharacterized protein LOC127867457 [Dreissena polymorpha]KAH3867153.1 hypothetical protein DPMN_030278 [Dreissena polymorpha]
MNDKTCKGEKKANQREVTNEFTNTSSSLKEKVMRPSDIRFCQESVSNKFRDGTRFVELEDDIAAGRRTVQSIPPIEIARYKGKWYSLDNRRLRVFKKLERKGLLDEIRVKVVENIPEWKLTTTNKGTSVEIRRVKRFGTNLPANKYKQKRSKKNKNKWLDSCAGERRPSECDTVEPPSRSLKQEVALESGNLPPDDAGWETLDDTIDSIDGPVLNECFIADDNIASIDDPVLNDTRLKLASLNLQATVNARKRCKKNTKLSGSCAGESRQIECNSLEGMKLTSRSLKQENELNTGKLPPCEDEWENEDDCDDSVLYESDSEIYDADSEPSNNIEASTDDPVLNQSYSLVNQDDAEWEPSNDTMMPTYGNL